jgi:invasion protein IalB
LHSTALWAQAATAPPAPAAWRVECTGDGKTLGCRAVEQIAQRNAAQQVVPLATLVVYYSSDTKTAVMQLLLPLGINLAEQVQLSVDNGPPEHQAIQSCNNAGCLAQMNLTDKFLAAMRGGTTLKITVQGTNKTPIDLPVPLLGFGLAYDKAR